MLLNQFTMKWYKNVLGYTPMRIAIFGQREHGKTTTAKMIRNFWHERTQEQIPIISFSHPLKMAMSYLTGMTIDELMVEKDKIPIGWKQTPRDGMKQLRDLIKSIVHPDILTIRLLSQYLHFIVDDGRHESEARMLQNQQVFNILICRSTHINSDEHSTEVWLGECYKAIPAFTSSLTLFDLVLWNNGTLENLREKVYNTIIPSYEQWVRKLLQEK